MWYSTKKPALVTREEKQINLDLSGSIVMQSFGVHMNGYVNIDGEKHLWVARRSDTKSTYPGRLDHIVAGGQVGLH